MIAGLRSFYRRRIASPVPPGALVLDVGSGDKPHWRADILVDRFPDAGHGVQRSGTAAVRVPRPLFDADVTALPFADQVFDYVICSHLLEHVLDPAAAIAEIVRVGRAGRVEVPSAASAKIIDFPSHLWWCREQGGTLTFEAKNAAAFDAEIESFARRPDIERALNALVDRFLDDWVITVEWRGDLPHRVTGTPSAELVAAVAAAPVHHKTVETLAARLLVAVLSLPARLRARRRVVSFDDVVRAELRTGDTAPLAPRIYRAPAS